MVKIIADPGSTHIGRLGLAKELIDVAGGSGCDSVKFQLFTNSPGNIPLPYHWMPELFQFGKDRRIEVFASVWDREGMEILWECGVESVKFSYSMNDSPLIQEAIETITTKKTQDYKIPIIKRFENIYISGDTTTNFPKNVTKLYCIPEYPVKYLVDFEGLFNERFDGFSDHTLGFQQTLQAVRRGAKVIEKHIRLKTSKCDTVPDGKFALTPHDLGRMVQAIRGIK